MILSTGALRAATNADVTLYSAAKIAMPTLGVAIGARPVAMGEAYTAAGRDLYALHYNPAGLARLSGYQLGLMHNEWSAALGMRQEFLGYGQSVGSSAGLALSVNYFSLGTLQERSSTGVPGTESGAYAMTGTLGYGFSVLSDDSLKLGLSAEYATQSILKTGDSAIAGGTGFQWELSRDFILGGALRHLGSAGGGFAPPSVASLGLAWSLARRKLTLAVDGSQPFVGEPAANAGLELNLGALAVRGGWRQYFGVVDGDVRSGLTAGTGFRAGLFAVDYAFVPYGELSTTHRVSAMLELPNDFFKPKIFGAESSTQTARIYYDKAVGLEKNGERIQAMVEYQRAKEAYPEALRAQPQGFYTTTLAKVAQLEADLQKGGNNEQVIRLVTKNINEGQAFMAEKRYREAFQRFKDALNLDANNSEAKRLRDLASEGLKERKSGLLLSAAAAAKQPGRLISAIEDYRKVQALDPADEAAAAFFSNRSAEIREQLKRVHRKGIDLYVAGRVADAISIWRKGSELDPEDQFGTGFRRDIEKGRKLLDARGGR